MPKVRMDAADLVRRGWSVRKVARYVGVSPGTILQRKTPALRVEIADAFTGFKHKVFPRY